MNLMKKDGMTITEILSLQLEDFFIYMDLFSVEEVAEETELTDDFLALF